MIKKLKMTQKNVTEDLFVDKKNEDEEVYLETKSKKTSESEIVISFRP